MRDGTHQSSAKHDAPNAILSCEYPVALPLLLPIANVRASATLLASLLVHENRGRAQHHERILSIRVNARRLPFWGRIASEMTQELTWRALFFLAHDLILRYP